MRELAGTLNKIKNYNSQHKHFKSPYLTVEDMINIEYALNKQTLKKVPDIEHFGRCPGCGGEFNSELLNEYNIMFCPWCGQALDWTN